MASYTSRHLFLHIPKCGGLYIQYVLDTYYGFITPYHTCRHHQWRQGAVVSDRGFLQLRRQGLRRYLQESPNYPLKDWSLPKWTVVRHPYDRLVSALVYLNRLYGTQLSLEEFIHHATTSRDQIDAYTWTHAFITQTQHLLSPQGTLDYYIARFENLEFELTAFLLRVGYTQLPHLEVLDRPVFNATPHPPFFTYYTQSNLEWVNTFFQEDFDNFNYPQATCLEELKTICEAYHQSPERIQTLRQRIIDTLRVNRPYSFSED